MTAGGTCTISANGAQSGRLARVDARAHAVGQQRRSSSASCGSTFCATLEMRSEHLGQLAGSGDGGEQLVEQLEVRRARPQLLVAPLLVGQPLMRQRQRDVIGDAPGDDHVAGVVEAGRHRPEVERADERAERAQRQPQQRAVARLGRRQFPLDRIGERIRDDDVIPLAR